MLSTLFNIQVVQTSEPQFNNHEICHLLPSRITVNTSVNLCFAFRIKCLIKSTERPDSNVSLFEVIFQLISSVIKHHFCCST